MGKLVSKGNGEATRDWMDAMKMLAGSVYGASADSSDFLRALTSEKTSLDILTRGLGKVDPTTAEVAPFSPGERVVTKTGIIRTPSGDRMVAAGDVISSLIDSLFEYKNPSELERLFSSTPLRGKTHDGKYGEEELKKILGGSTTGVTGGYYPKDEPKLDVEELKRSFGKFQGSMLRDPIGAVKKPEAPKSDVPVDVGEHVGSW